MITVLLVSVAGGFGAVARFVVDGLVSTGRSLRYPVGTTLINVSGSLALGLVAGLVFHHGWPPGRQLVLGTGFLGGYTTFSTASYETVRLAREQRWSAALANGFGMAVASVAMAGLGLWLGSR